MTKSLSRASLLALLCLCFSYSSHAQDAPADTPEHQLILNGTRFVKTFLNFNDTGIEDQGLQVGYKRYKGDKAFRVFLGGAFDISTQKDEPSSPFEPSTENTNQLGMVDFRVGLEKKIDLTPKWNFYFGVDAVASQEFTKVKTEFNFEGNVNTVKTENETLSFGAAPLVGIQFNLNDRLSLMTEANFPLLFGVTNTKREDSNFPQSNDEDKTQTFSTNIQVPGSVYLVIKL